MNTTAVAPATTEVPAWRPFAALPLAEAAFVAARSTCESSSLHVTCIPGTTSFAVAGQDTDHGWHWAIFSAFGIRLDHGWEETLSEAQRVATEVRQLWAHHCEARERCVCRERCR